MIELPEGLISGVKPSASAKAFLATEQRIPGLGNGCLQDILFRAGLNPRKKLEDWPDRDGDKVFQGCDGRHDGTGRPRHGKGPAGQCRRIQDAYVQEHTGQGMPCLRTGGCEGGLSGRDCVLLPCVPAIGFRQISHKAGRHQAQISAGFGRKPAPNFTLAGKQPSCYNIFSIKSIAKYCCMEGAGKYDHIRYSQDGRGFCQHGFTGCEQ